MPNFPWLGRQDPSAIEDAALAAMLSGPDVPEDLAAGLQPAADVLAALRARPSGDELAGEAFAMAEFRNRVGVPDPVRRTRPRRRPALLTSLVSAKVAVAAAAVAITIGGVATAAYAGALPAPAQRLAHDVIGAPAERSASHSSGDATAADRTGSRRPFRHHFTWHGCGTPKSHRSWMPRPHSSWTPQPHPSWTATPHPSWTPKPHPTCTPAPHPSGTPHPARTPRPHPSFMPGKFRHHFRHHNHRYPGHRPGPHPTGSPAPRPTSMPSPQPSGQQ
jgi:cell division septation protein DedD